MLSAIIFLHPLTPTQWLASLLVFGALYYKAFAGDSKPKHAPQPEAPVEGGNKAPLLGEEQEGELQMVAVQGNGASAGTGPAGN